MRTLLVYTSPVAVTDSLNEPVTDTQVLGALADISCTQGTVLDYLGPEIPNQAKLRGGYLRLVVDRKRLCVRIEIDSPSKLSKSELKALHDDLNGQISDGIGEGGFDFVADASGLTVKTLADPGRKKSTLVQETGNAWRPKSHAAEQAANRRRCQKAVAAAESLERAQDHMRAKKAVKHDPKNLLKLIDKGFRPPRAAGIEALFAAEIAQLGGDLSFLGPGLFPFVRLSDLKLLRLLLDAGLSPNLHDRDGHSLLWLAAGDAKCVTLLLDRGADVNLRNTLVYQDTALMDAASRGELKIVRLLLERGADPNLKDFFGRTALDQARKAKHHRGAAATAKLLEEAMQE